MKIVLMTNLFPNPEEPIRGIFTAQLASEMKRLGEVTIVSPLPWFPNLPFLKYFRKWYKFSRIPPTWEFEGMRVYYPKYLIIPRISEFFQSFFVFLSVFWIILRLRRAARADVINVHWVYPDGVAAFWIAKILKIPILISGLGCDINRDGWDLKKRIQIVPVLRSAGRVTTVSQALKENVCRLGIPENKVVVIPNGIDSRKFYPLSKEACRRSIGLNGIEEGEKVLLFVGQLVEVKGLNDLLDAILLLKKSSRVRFRLLLVGEGPLQNDLKKKVTGFGLEEEVFFSGPKPHDEIAVWMGACDLLTLPSIREGQPNVVLEALASGRPVVATAVGGVPELVSEEKENGILCLPHDAKSLARALLKGLETSYSPERISRTVARRTWETSARMYFHEMESMRRP